MTAFGLDDAPVPRDGLIVHVLDDEAVVFAPATGDLHHLDRPATLVWQLLQPGVVLRQTVAEIAAASGAPFEQVEADVLGLVLRLGELGLLDPSSSTKTTTPARRHP